MIIPRSRASLFRQRLPVHRCDKRTKIPLLASSVEVEAGLELVRLGSTCGTNSTGTSVSTRLYDSIWPSMSHLPPSASTIVESTSRHESPHDDCMHGIIDSCGWLTLSSR